jgi:hypothetical protein
MTIYYEVHLNLEGRRLKLGVFDKKNYQRRYEVDFDVCQRYPKFDSYYFYLIY